MEGLFAPTTGKPVATTRGLSVASPFASRRVSYQHRSLNAREPEWEY
jgi:hypothetical protein